MASKANHGDKSSVNISRYSETDSNAVNHVNEHRLPLDSNKINEIRDTGIKYNCSDKHILLNGGGGAKPKRPRDVPSVVIPGNFDFIDDINASCTTNENPDNIPLKVFRTAREITSVNIPGDFEFIDEINISLDKSKNKISNDGVALDVNSELTNRDIRESVSSNNIQEIKPRNQKQLLRVYIPGDYDFIDDSLKPCERIANKDSERNNSRNSTDNSFITASVDSPQNVKCQDSERIFENSSRFTEIPKCKEIPFLFTPESTNIITDTSNQCKLVTNEKSSGNKSRSSNKLNDISFIAATGDSLQDARCHEHIDKSNSKNSNHTVKISECMTIPFLVVTESHNDTSNPCKLVTNKDYIENNSRNTNDDSSVHVTTDLPKDDKFLETTRKDTPESPNHTGKSSKCTTDIPTIIIPGNFYFADDHDMPSTSHGRSHSRTSINANSTNSKESVASKNGLVVDTKTSNTSSNTRPPILDGRTTKHSRDIPSVVIPGDFDFIDEMNAPLNGERLLSVHAVPNKRNEHHRHSPNKSIRSDSSGPSSPGERSSVIFKIPSIYLPSNLQYIDDTENSAARNDRKLKRGDKAHSSLRITRSHSTKRRLCRHHSDSEAKASGEATARKPKHHRSRSKRVRRSVSAIETSKDNYRTRVRRSLSDRSGMIIAGKHLRPPYYRSRPHSYYENNSSRCSSTRTLSTNVSISEMVAVEMGLKEIPGFTVKEARRRRIVCTVGVVTITIIVLCVLLLALTLLLSPEIDDVPMSSEKPPYQTDTSQLHVQCHSKSRCSAKSHSSSCLSSQYENHYFEGGGGGTGPLWFTRDEEFPRLISTPPSSSKDPDAAEVVPKKKKKKKRKKKVFAIDVVPGATRVTTSGSRKSHKCRRGGVCKRQRLHSEDSSNKRSSGFGRDSEHSKRARLAIIVVALSLIMLSFLLVGLTLRMAPIIDELVRKGNEEIYRSMAAGASTSSPTTEGAAVVANNSAPPSGTPG